MKTAIERLKAFSKWAKDNGHVKSEREFENVCGLAYGYINHMMNAGKGNIGSDKIANVANRFPMLNVRWLCTGVGDMVIDDDSRDARINEALRLVKELEKSIHVFSHL